MLQDGKAVTLPEAVANAHMRLFGGAQYHRAVAEFKAIMSHMTCPDISREEIVNACGVDDLHDGVNYTRTACVIAVTKAREIFEPFLHQLGYRLAHVLRRLLPIAMYLLQREGAFLNGHDLFLKRVGASYHAFIEDMEKNCRGKCVEDLLSTTRYVTWSLHNKSRGALKTMMAKVEAKATAKARADAAAAASSRGKEADADASTIMDMLDASLWNRQLAVMSEEMVAALVCQIFEGRGVFLGAKVVGYCMYEGVQIVHL